VLAVAVATSGCCTLPVVELVPCEDPSEAAMQQIDQLPELWFDWYWNVYDPRCEAIFNAMQD
jgi:hypothetical protein